MAAAHFLWAEFPLRKNTCFLDPVDRFDGIVSMSSVLACAIFKAFSVFWVIDVPTYATLPREQCFSQLVEQVLWGNCERTQVGFCEVRDSLHNFLSSAFVGFNVRDWASNTAELVVLRQNV